MPTDQRRASSARRAAQVVLAALVLLAPGTSAAAKLNARTLRLQPHWKPAGTASGLTTSGRYVFIPSGSHGAGTVIDEQSHRRTDITAPCPLANPQFGGPWLMFDCGRQAALYDPAASTWRTVTADPSLDCHAFSDCSMDATAVGAVWIRFDAASQCMEHGCSRATGYQNLQTGQLAPADTLSGWRPGGRIIPNLDSPSLTQKLCAPLRVPTSRDINDLPVPGEIRFFGRHAVEVTSDPATGAQFTLVHCGARQRVRMKNAGGYTANRQMVVWNTDSAHRLQGIFLRSQRRFSLRLPAGVRGNGAIQYGLSARTLYVENLHTGRLWRTPAPRRRRH